MRDRRKSERRISGAGAAAAYAVRATPENPDRRRSGVPPRRAPVIYGGGGMSADPATWTPPFIASVVFITVAMIVLLAFFLALSANSASAEHHSADCTEKRYRHLRFVQCNHHYPHINADCVSVNVIGPGSTFSRNQSTGFHCIPHQPK